MSRQQKAATIESLHADFASSKAAFVVGYQGLTVAQMQKLRSELRSKGGTLKVAKARLMKRASDGLDCADDLMPMFKEQIGLVFAQTEASGVAKVLHDFAKAHEALRLIGGCVEDSVIDGASIVRIASLPPREVLLAQLCGTVQAPVVNLARVLSLLTTRLVWTLKQVGEKKQ